MEPHPFAQHLESVHQRAVALLERAQAAAPHVLRDWIVPDPTQAAHLRLTWHELTTTLAELLTVYAAVQAQRPRYQDLVEFAPDGYLVTDAAGVIREANAAAAQLFALPVADLAGKRLTDLVAPDATAALQQDLADLLATISSKRRETRLRPHQGPPFEGAYVVVPAHDEQGQVIELRWLVWDTSERQRQDQALLLARQAAEQAAERAARLQAVIARLVEALTADQVLAAVVHQGAAALGGVAGVLNLLTDDGLRLTTIGVGHPEPVLEHYRDVPISAAWPGADVLRTGEPLWIESHQEFSARYPHLAEAGANAGVEAVAVLPLSADRHPIGALAVSFAQPRAFPPEDQAFLVALAHLSAQTLARHRALAAENAQLRQDVAARAARQAASDRDLEQLHKYTADLALAREDERRRLALDLHDQLGGALTGLKMDVYMLRRALGEREPAATARLDTMSTALSGTLALVRDLATELRPAMLDDLGLPAALEWTAGEFETRYGIPCQWVTNTDTVRLDTQPATAIFRVVQECLTNIVRHAQATAVTITLDAQPDQLVVTVRDNGRGFAYDPATRMRSMGLAGIYDRVRAIDGALAIETAPGAGTLVRLRVALRPDSA